MKTVCRTHEQAYEADGCCPYCERSAGAVITEHRPIGCYSGFDTIWIQGGGWQNGVWSCDRRTDMRPCVMATVTTTPPCLVHYPPYK